ncbi:MAG TPA: hypothetical protein DIT97_17545 [Gimesia maris]|nr:hypothetical protein [Gimesia maris]
MLNYSDFLIGRLVKAMDELGIRDNTILFIVPDNGTDNGTDQNAEQSLGGRINGRISEEGIYSLKEQGINMPLIINCPRLVGTERISDDLVDIADVLPTLADLANAPLPDGVTIDGKSFAPQILNQPRKEPWRSWCLTQYYKQRVIRDQRFKLYSTGEFFDLSEDPLEQHDLSRSERLKNENTSLKSYAQLKSVLDSLPENAKLPWEFRSISARRIKAQEELLKKTGTSEKGQ